MGEVYSALCQESCHFCGWVDNAVSFMFILNENIESKSSYMKGECATECRIQSGKVDHVVPYNILRFFGRYYVTSDGTYYRKVKLSHILSVL